MRNHILFLGLMVVSLTGHAGPTPDEVEQKGAKTYSDKSPKKKHQRPSHVLHLISWDCPYVSLKDDKPDNAAAACMRAGRDGIQALERRACHFEENTTMTKITGEGFSASVIRAVTPGTPAPQPENKGNYSVSGDVPCVVTKSQVGGKQDISLRCYARSDDCVVTPNYTIVGAGLVACGPVERFTGPQAKAADFGDSKLLMLSDRAKCVYGNQAHVPAAAAAPAAQ